MDRKTDSRSENKFKDFNGTYPLCAFSLAFAFLYPNRTNTRKRCVWITILIALNGGQLFWFFTYTFKCLMILDVFNSCRNFTLGVVLFLFFMKTYYGIGITFKFSALLRWMSRDLLRANNLSEDYQKIYEKHIYQAKIGEWAWLLTPTVMSGFFPIYAGICTTIRSIQMDNFERMMVHDMDLMFVEHLQNDWPYFHLMFAYNCCQCVILVPNFCGFDGSFCIATTHLRLKFSLMIKKLQEAYSEPRSYKDLKARVSEIIVEHQDALAFYKMIHDIYGPWLFCVFMLTSFMISLNLYQIYHLRRLEPKFTMFACVGVCHIFWPCHFAATLTEFANTVGSQIYNVPWEKSPYLDVTRILVFMIARAQQPIIITGWIIIFNMDLFKAILQTSYSFFTLLTA